MLRDMAIYYADHSAGEVAEKFNISADTVYMKLAGCKIKSEAYLAEVREEARRCGYINKYGEARMKEIDGIYNALNNIARDQSVTFEFVEYEDLKKFRGLLYRWNRKQGRGRFLSGSYDYDNKKVTVTCKLV